MADDYNDNFRPEFKRYKKKSPPPCFKDVLDTDNDGHEKMQMLYRIQIPREEDTNKTRSEADSFGLKNPSEWQSYGSHDFPGFRFIRNPFLPGAQRYWVKRCLADYPCKPNVTNLDTHYHHDQLCNPWQTRRKNIPCQQTKEKTLMDQLRWVTLGYHYDWDNKVYNEDQYSPFPEDLGLMSSLIAEVLGYPRFEAQAGIVNFYHMDSTLGGHTDHSEFDLTAPLISYSLGQSAIFLVGGTTKATKPLALHLRSGDVIVLGGASRLAYHAVPRIMYAHGEGQLPQCFDLTDDLLQQPESEVEGVAGSSLEDGGHTSSALRGAQEDMENRCDETCNAAIDVEHSGKPSDSVASSAAGDHRPKKVHEQCPNNTSPDEPCESVGGCINRTAITDTVCVSRTNPSNSADLGSAYIVRVSKNISSAIKSLSREDHWKEFEEYLKHGRMNISVRQVTGPGKGFPEKESCQGESDRDMLQSSDAKRTKVNSK